MINFTSTLSPLDRTGNLKEPSFNSCTVFVVKLDVPDLRFTKVYVDGVYYNQRIDPAGVTLPYDQWYFWLDTNPATGFGWNIEFETGYIPANGAVIDVRIDNSLWQNLDNGVTELTTNDYQVTSLEDVIGSFMIAYVGEDKLISKVNRTDVQFHAMRTLQE